MPLTDTSRADRRSLRRVQTRGRLVDAARRIIARRGSIEAVPIEEIAEEAAVATGSFYNHFASKDELFEAAVSEAAQQHAAQLEARIPTGRSSPWTGRTIPIAPAR